MNQEPVVKAIENYSQISIEGFQTPKFEFQAYRYDEGKEAQFHYQGEVDHNIRRKVRDFQPHIIIFSGPAGGNCQPSLETLLTLKEKAKTIGYFLDGGCPDWHPFLLEYAKHNVFDVMVNMDGNPYWPRRAHDITTWGLLDRSYYEKELPKDIHFGFAGGAGSKHRQDALAVLTKHHGLVIAPRNETWGSYQAFADFMLRTDITVNFPEAGIGKVFHFKYRVVESGFAKCVLFERENPITRLYLDRLEDYFEYKDLDHLQELLANLDPSEADRRRLNLYNKVRNSFKPEVVWNEIFKVIGVPYD